jgi:hypothetical protein
MLISPEYKDILHQTHNKLKSWGNTAGSRYKMIVSYLQKYSCTTLLDYGSGSSSLKNALDKYYPNVYNVLEYEPGAQDKCSPPEPCEFVVCIDVLEHVEPDYIDAVLDDLQRVVIGTAIFTISTEPAFTTLTDGRNAHLIIQPYIWWYDKIASRFDIVTQSHNTSNCFFILKTKQNANV